MQGKVVRWHEEDRQAARELGKAGIGILVNGYLLQSTSEEKMEVRKFKPETIHAKYSVDIVTIELLDYVWEAFQAYLKAAESFNRQAQAFRLLIEKRRGYA